MPVATKPLTEKQAASKKKPFTFKRFLKNSFTYGVSVLGAIGIGLQNHMAIVQLIKEIAHEGFALSKAGWAITHGIALSLGGIASGLVNFFINKKLLNDFWKRITGQKKQAKEELGTWQSILKWGGSIVFIITGILFGMTAFAFGPIGPLVAISIGAGICVAVIMTIQELETWLARFDAPEEENSDNKAVKSSKGGKIIGHAIAIGNVIALSLLFAFGLGTFLMGIGVAPLVAVLLGFGFAFTAGAFTEFYFFNYFISDFCEKIETAWHDFWQSKHATLGFAASITNALVNGVLSYIGITAIVGLLTAASIAIPPLGVIIGIAVVASLFAATASFFLAIDFWKRNNSPNDNEKKKLDAMKGTTNTVNEKLTLLNNAKPQQALAITLKQSISEPKDNAMIKSSSRHFKPVNTRVVNENVARNTMHPGS